MSDRKPVVAREHHAAEVETDFEINKGFLIYFAVLSIAGATILVLTIVKGWGFWGWFGAVFLLIAGVGGGLGMVQSGGAGKVACPACGHSNAVLHINRERVMQCSGCRAWLEGSTQMLVCPDDRITDTPSFETALPKDIRWPEGCPTCGEPCTRTMKVQGTSMAGDMTAMVAPVSVQRVTKVQVPCCDQHDDGGVWVFRRGSESFICFRSLAYCRAFERLNAAD